ncbi:hypothetical protein N7520_003736 [Penicillium odoratum]|uniref:uncharacterized protein n=1 Tax=Penicillium odoratum TaxID=1167516 RepID=UPI0025494698|nr:uncharacterized protein N7520_003736 [Penicillium odoratum]KAJ5769177.1 hypothetical protein N7520_003736 [Penicillium odoratum]
MLDAAQLLTLGFVFAMGYVVYNDRKGDPREPPVVTNKIPLVGHLLGLITSGFGYFTILAKNNRDKPIFTSNIVFNKTYIITSPDLMQAAQRHNKTLKLDPLVTWGLRKVAGIENEKTLDLLREKESGGVIGPNKCMTRLLLPYVDRLGESPKIGLYGWCREAITDASTESLYGPLNPYGNLEVAEASSSLAVNPFPRLTARKTLKARSKVCKSIVKYIENNGPQQGSELAIMQYKTVMQAGVSMDESAKMEIPITMAFLSNTVPAAFWVLFDLYTRPKLRAEIREELKTNALSVAVDESHNIDIGAMREKCPLLLSTFQEVLRTRTTTCSSRIVLQDTLLAKKYLLKRGSMLNILADAMGYNSTVWGANSAVFDARRFIKTVSSDDTEGKKDVRRPGQFMTFGISPVICPGRHFASSEILGLVAMMILRYDVEPVNGSWKEPPRNQAALVSIMGAIKGKCLVKVARRNEFQGVKWGFKVEEGQGQFPLVIG